MTRFWIGAVTLLILLGLGITMTLLYSQTYDPMAEDLSAAADLALKADLAGAKGQVSLAKTHWERYRNFAGIVTDHELLEEMDSMFAQLAQETDPMSLAMLCTRLSAWSQALAESQKITWWNLL